MTQTEWSDLLTEVPRTPFIPDTIWVGDEGADLVPLSRHDDPQGWQALVDSDQPVVTQVDDGAAGPEGVGWMPTSSCSQPTVVAAMLDALDVRAGQRILEIGTGTGWNAALLCRRVGPDGRVVTIEVDPGVADAARVALARAGYEPLVVTGDGVLGYAEDAPYDRLIATATVRGIVPRAWLTQTRPGGLVVLPWANDYIAGAQLVLTVGPNGNATGRFTGTFGFMALRSQRRRYYSPTPARIRNAQTSTTDVHGRDFWQIINTDEAAMSIGLRVPHCNLTVHIDHSGNARHSLELDDIGTRSWARFDAHLTSPDKLFVHQLGPRKLWDEVVAAFDWWYDMGRPGLSRFGMTITDAVQTIWLDDPTNIVVTLT